jgi:hypothetical protein
LLAVLLVNLGLVLLGGLEEAKDHEADGQAGQEVGEAS